MKRRNLLISPVRLIKAHVGANLWVINLDLVRQLSLCFQKELVWLADGEEFIQGLEVIELVGGRIVHGG